jgi:hypothetical protein
MNPIDVFTTKCRTRRWLLALSLSGIIALVGISGEAFGFTPPRYHFQRICAHRAARRAHCSGMFREPGLLTGPQASGQPEAPSEAAPNGGGAAVLFNQPPPNALSPEAIHAAYALPTATPSSALQTIAVIDAYDDPTAESDLGVFDRKFGLPACAAKNGCFRKVNEQGSESPLPPTEGAWASETSADVQLAHAVCQSCHVLLVEADSEEFSDLGTAVNTAIAAGATEVNNSYESEGEEAPVAAMLNALYYNHPGIVVTASAGDCGYRGEACEASGVSFPASSPDIVAVGATALSESEGTWASRAWVGTGGGCSTVFSAPPWQLAIQKWPRTGCGTARLVTDVAAVGAPETGVSVYDSTPFSPGVRPRGWGADGGTSVSAPIVTAEFALDGGAHGVNYPARTLYSHLGDSRALYDVRTGTNGSCEKSPACDAGSGYDGPSGVGSPIGLTAFSVVGAPTEITPPSIIGSSRLGQILGEIHGRWRGKPDSYVYQWARCVDGSEYCQPIPGATASTYTVTSADVGFMLRVQETASNASGEGAPAVSGPTAPVLSR